MARETDGSGGMDWAFVTKPVNAYDNLTLGHIWLSNILSTIIFNVILWYFDNVRPGKYGVAQKLYFPFQVEHQKRKEIVNNKEVMFLKEILLVWRNSRI